jgi:hypothetical protein
MVRKIGVIEGIEEFRTKLSRPSCVDVPLLRNRQVEVLQAGIAENVAAHRALGSKSRGESSLSRHWRNNRKRLNWA